MASSTVGTPAAGTRKKRSRRRFTGLRRWLALSLIAVPLVLIALKASPLAIGAVLRSALSLSGRASEVRHTVAHVLLVPFGAAIVVFFRTTLGIRVLGPFRSVLLAIAFQTTGIPLGLFFLALVLAVMVTVRPLLRKMKLPNYGRLSVSLSTVAALIMVTMVVGRALHLEVLHRAMYFPIVVLCLTADGFAGTLRREGARSALWRGSMTAAVAVLITGIAAIPGFEGMLARYPELLFLEIGASIIFSTLLAFRVLSRLNPPRQRAKRRKTGGAVAGTNQAPGRGREALASAGPGLDALTTRGNR